MAVFLVVDVGLIAHDLDAHILHLVQLLQLGDHRQLTEGANIHQAQGVLNRQECRHDAGALNPLGGPVADDLVCLILGAEVRSKLSAINVEGVEVVASAVIHHQRPALLVHHLGHRIRVDTDQRTAYKLADCC